MSRKIIKTVPYRRKREGKTNYRKRIELLKSKKPRLVIRKSNNNTLAQIIVSDHGKDKVIVSAHTRELIKLGWDKHRGNIPAAYLVGYLIGKKAIKKNIKDCIVDAGLQSLTKGCRIYATLKGAVDAGLNVPHNPTIFPNEDRICGKHINDEIPKLFKNVKENISKLEVG